MRSRLFLSVMVLALGFGSLVDGATIVWVSDNKTPSNGVPADQGWVDLLIAQGYTVDLSFRNKEARTLDATKIAALNAADLIIISRDTNSGDYDDGTETAQWNAITAPILMQIAHIAQSSRWKWVNIGSTNSAQPTLEAVLPTHPVFNGVSLGASNQVSILTTNCSFVSTVDAGNGRLIARRGDNGQAWIIEWEPGVEFYAGAVEKAGGKRMLFSGGGTSGVSDGTYNYTDDGKKMFLNAVKYLLGIKSTASEPGPANGAVDVPRDGVLSWKPALPSQKHDVYFGTSIDDVNTASPVDPRGVLAGVGQDANTFDPTDLLPYGQTYYWRVDEVNATPDATIFKGDVWSFTVEPFSYPLTNVAATASSAAAGMGPENTVNGSGLNDRDEHSTNGEHMWLSAGVQPDWILFEFDSVYKLDELWVWNSNQLVEKIVGFGAKDVTVEYSLDSSAWTELASVPPFEQADGADGYIPDTPIDFGGVLAKYVRLTVNSTWGGIAQCGLSEVRFFYIPVRAREPMPADGATDVDLDATLSWRPGREAASHTAYFSQDPDAVTDGTAPATTVTDHSFSPTALDYGATYRWRVDEVNEAVVPGVYEGPVWSFTTVEYRVVDDFESYNDEENKGTRIYETWLDGWDDAKNGSQVGYADPPFAERNTVHGGRQSMPLLYDNTTTSYAEGERTFDEPQDWTAAGIKSLSLYFYGAPANTGQLYLKINNTKVPYSGDAGDIAATRWQIWPVDLSTVGGNLRSVTKLTIGLEGAGATGIVYIDDIRLYPRAPEYITPVEPDSANLLAYYDFEGDADDRSGSGLHGTIVDGQLAGPGKLGEGTAVQVNDAGYVDLGNPALLDFSTGDWTVTAWFKTGMTGTGDDNKGTIFAKGGDTAGGHRYALIMSETTEGVVTLVCDDDVTKEQAHSTTKTNDDQWHFVAGQREGASIRIYIDGRLEATEPVEADYNLAGTAQHNAYIGASTNHTSGSLYKLFIGLIDDVRVYDRALSEGEILWLAGKTKPVARPF